VELLKRIFALDALLTGETEEWLSMLRDLIHAKLSFKELSRITGVGEKSLHRMLSRRGNPRQNRHINGYAVSSPVGAAKAHADR